MEYADRSRTPDAGTGELRVRAESVLEEAAKKSGKPLVKIDSEMSADKVAAKMDSLLSAATTSEYTRTKANALMEVAAYIESYPAELNQKHIDWLWDIVHTRGDNFVRAGAIDAIDVSVRLRPEIVTRQMVDDAARYAVMEKDQDVIGKHCSDLYRTLLDKRADLFDREIIRYLADAATLVQGARCYTAMTLIDETESKITNLVDKPILKQLAEIPVPCGRLCEWEIAIPQQNVVLGVLERNKDYLDEDILEIIAMRAVMHKKDSVRSLMKRSVDVLLDTQAHHATDRLMNKLTKIAGARLIYGRERSEMALTIRDSIDVRRDDLLALRPKNKLESFINAVLNG